MQNARFSAITLLLVMLILLSSWSPVISSLMNSVIIRSTGQISTGAYARSGSARDIQAAVDWVVAHGGIGNVYIPEGTFNFVEVGEPWMTVNIPAGVNLFGAPTDRYPNGTVVDWKTVLVMPYDVPGDVYIGFTRWFTIKGNGDPAKPSRFSDIKLVGYRTFNSSSISQYCGIEITNVMDFRVDHCYFHNIAGSALAVVRGRGVVDHNILINDVGIPGVTIYEETVGYGIELHGDSTWDDNIYNVVGHYTNNTVFIEDNYLSKWRHGVASNDGAHYVFRHNTIKDDFGFGSLDAHGTYNIVGTRAVEIYENKFLNSSLDWTRTVMFHRGGGGVYFNNLVSGGYTTFIQMVNEGSVPKCWPNEVYIWNNTLVGANAVSTDGGPVEGVNYHFTEMPNYIPYPYPHPMTLEAEA